MPRAADPAEYAALPAFLPVREIRVPVEQAGFRSRVIIVVTTMIDEKEIRRDDLAELYFARWNAELDLRSLKATLQMDVLRCKTQELVRKEIWTHVLACNLIRTLMAQAAAKQDAEPRTVSFKGVAQTLKAFQPMIATCGSELRRQLYNELLDAVAAHRVGDRPGRYEPRNRKRRHQWNEILSTPETKPNSPS